MYKTHRTQREKYFKIVPYKNLGSDSPYGPKMRHQVVRITFLGHSNYFLLANNENLSYKK